MVRFVLVFITASLIALANGVTLYVNSSFLGKFLSDGYLSLPYFAAAGVNVALFFLAPRLLRRFSKEALLLVSLAAAAAGTLAMGFSTALATAVLSFVVAGGFFIMGYYFLDILLEELSSDGRTGAIRGLYFTFVNGSLALGPLLLALLVPSEALRPVFLCAGAILIGAFVSAAALYRLPKPPIHHKYRLDLSLPLKLWWRMRNVRAVTFARLSLEVFFAMMVVYVPVYLHENIGFAWKELGLMFTVMLIPFIVLEWPAGEAADRWWGEKEIMSGGFFLMGAMLLLMPFLGHTFAHWLVALLLSRVGASLVEIATESYFFKKVSADDTGLLGIFRLTRPASFIVGAGLGTVALSLYSFAAVFFVAAFVVMAGMYESLHLRDTK